MELKGLLLVCISLCCCSPTNLSRISIAVDGGYGNIVVKISSLLSDKSCGTILRNVQELFKKSSGVLSTSLSGRGYFREVVVVIPSSWDSSMCGFPLESLSAGTAYRNADVMIEEEDPVHGHSPFTQQSRGCGESGDKIYLPTSFIKEIDNTTVAATQFVEQWIKYRYGVFEATGYPGDKLYPDDLGEDVNKHNVICGGRSVQNIISSHADFLTVKTDNEPERDISPIVRIVQEPSVKYILAIETTSSMSVGDHWKWVNKAAQKLIRLDLPLNRSMAVMTFNNGSKVVHPMIQVDGEKERAKLADTIPGKYHLADNNVRCVACVLDMAVNQVMEEDTVGAHIVLITRGSSDSLSLTDERIISEYVNNYDIKVSSIIIPTVNHLSFYDQISKVSGGHSFLIRDSGFSMDAYVSVVEAFQTILNEDSKDPSFTVENIHTNEYLTGGRELTTGTFSLDHSAVKKPIFGIYVEDEEDHLIKSIEREDSEGRVYGPYTKMSSTFDLINYKTVNYAGESPLFNENISNWKYTVHWFHHKGEPRKSLIKVTSNSGSNFEDEIFVKVWTSDPAADGFKPIAVFAEIKKGNSPMIGALVVVDIEVENENGSLVTLSSLELGDNGLGEPDLMARDGLYSSFITEYSVTGRYSLSVRVNDNQGEAYSVRPNGQSIGCCSSFLDIPETQKNPTGEFQKTLPGPIFHLSNIPATDVIPPAKVSDLEIELEQDNSSLVATWTAPGDDYHVGDVARYKFVYAEQISDLLNASSEKRILVFVDISSPSGSLMSEKLEFALFDKVYYMGLYSYDTEGNQGRLSNIVQVFVPSPEVISPRTMPIPHLSLSSSSNTDWLLVVTISAGLGALLLVCVLSIVLYCITGRSARPSSPCPSNDNLGSDHTDSSSCNSGNSNLQLDVKDLENQITDATQVIDQHRNPPVYWSASQLLSKIESPTCSIENDSYGFHGTSLSPSLSRAPIHKNPAHNQSAELEYFQRNNRLRSSTLNRTPEEAYVGTVEDTYLGFDCPVPDRQSHTQFESRIPEEFCVTVSSVSESGSDKQRKPPPLMPKPRSITCTEV